MTEPTILFTRAELLPERLADWLRDEIVTGHLAPGERLTEQALCARAGVSRVPLREALRILAADGLVQLSAHRGAVVMLLTTTEMQELFGLRLALEGFAAAEAARLRTPADLVELRGLTQQMRDAVAMDELDAYHALAATFHARLVALGGNALLTATFTRLRVRLKRYQIAMARVPDLPAKSIEEHERIVDAIAASDRRTARARTEAHLRALVRRLQAAHPSISLSP